MGLGSDGHKLGSQHGHFLDLELWSRDLFFKFQFPYVLSGELQWYLLHTDVVRLNLESTCETE